MYAHDAHNINNSENASKSPRCIVRNYDPIPLERSFRGRSTVMLAYLRHGVALVRPFINRRALGRGIDLSK